MLKKALAGLATLALALGAVVATAAPASAHHNTINPVITCTDDFQYEVTWSVTNSESLTETITYSSDEALVPSSTGNPGNPTTLGDKETKQFVEYFAAPVNKTLELWGKWSNNNTAKNSASIKKNDFPDCDPQHVPVTICHATPPDTAANGWEKITVDDDSIVTSSGHADQHDADIIPAFTYWAKDDNGVWSQQYFPGKNLDTTFSGISGSAILSAACDYKTTPVEASITNAQCTGPGVYGAGSYVIPSTPGVRYEVRINNGSWQTASANTYPAAVGTIVEIRAVGDPTWVKLLGTTSWGPVTITAPTDCRDVVTPVAPEVTMITECGVYGSVVPASTPGVVYEFTIGDGTEGAWEIKATPAAGYKFDGDQIVYFSDNVGEYTDCVTPAEATFVQSECTKPGEQSGGSYTIPVTEGVTYQVKVGEADWVDAEDGTFPVTVYPTTVTVRAVANDGYTLKDYTGDWSETFESAGECLTVVTPVAPTAVGISECGSYGSVTPEETEGVVYELTTGDGKQGAWVVTATPADGYVFEGEQEVTFEGDLGKYTDCVTAQVPGFTDEDCSVVTDDLTTAAGILTIPSFEIMDTTGVQYSVSINGSDFVDYAAGTYEAAVGDVIVVRAAALPGYTLEGESEWTHTILAFDGECDPPTLGEVFPSASVSNQTCTAQGAITVVPTAHVIYKIDGVEVTEAVTPKAPGTYTVTAQTDSPEYGIFGPNEWVFTVAPPLGACAALLASTGSYAPLLATSLATGLLVIGGMLLMARRRRDA